MRGSPFAPTATLVGLLAGCGDRAADAPYWPLTWTESARELAVAERSRPDASGVETVGSGWQVEADGSGGSEPPDAANLLDALSGARRGTILLHRSIALSANPHAAPALLLGGVVGSYDVLVDGRPVHLARHGAGDTLLGYADPPTLVPLPVRGTVELTLRAWNDGPTGPIALAPPRLGTRASLEPLLDRALTLQRPPHLLAIGGMFLFLSLYHLVLFTKRREERAHLYMAGYAAALALRLLPSHAPWPSERYAPIALFAFAPITLLSPLGVLFVRSLWGLPVRGLLRAYLFGFLPLLLAAPLTALYAPLRVSNGWFMLFLAWAGPSFAVMFRDCLVVARRGDVDGKRVVVGMVAALCTTLLDAGSVIAGRRSASTRFGGSRPSCWRSPGYSRTGSSVRRRLSMS